MRDALGISGALGMWSRLKFNMEANMPAADGGVRHDALLRFFVYDVDDTSPIGVVNQKLAELAQQVMSLPSNAERTSALRKLLEARDCANRAHSFQ